MEGYRASGGIRGAVARSAEQVYDELPEGDRSRLRDLMLRLLTLAPDGEPLRSSVPRGAIPADAAHQQLVEMLVRARLVTAEADVLALAHETLARAWPRLRGWLDDDLEGQRILRHLSTAAASWSAMGRPDAELYRGDRRLRARDWQGRSGADLTDTERDFLDRAGQVADQEAAIQEREARYRRRTRRRLTGLVAVAACLTLVAGVAGAVALRQRDEAASERQQAAAERLVASARRAATLSQGTDNIGQALLLALEAVRRDDSPDTWASLLAALARSPALVGVIATDGSPNIDASPVGGQLAVRDDFRLRLFDDESPTSEEICSDFGSWVEFAPDGALLTTLASTLVELDGSGRETRQFTVPGQHPPWWSRATYSGDGRRVAAEIYREDDESESAVVVWDVDRPDLPTGRVTPGQLRDFALDQAGTRLIGVSNGPTWITMYDTATGRRLATVPPSPETRGRDDPRMVRLSPDGAVLAVNDGADVALLHPGTLRETTRLRGHTSRVTALDFSQDGRLVAAGAVDGTVLVWARRTGALVEQLGGPPAEVTDLAFAPDSDTLYSASREGGVLVSDLGGRRRFVSRVTGAIGDFGPLTLVAPDGRSVAHFRSGAPTSGRARGLDLTQVPSGRHSTLAGEYPNWGAYSPTGDRLATAVGNRVQVWDPRDGRLVKEREVPGIDHAQAVTFTGDGSWLVVGERAGTVQALDAGTLAPVGRRASTPSAGATAAMAENGPQLAELLPTPDGRRVIAFASDDAAYAVVDPATGRVLDEVDLHWEPYATDGAVSPDGERLALTGEDGWVGVVDLRSGTWLTDPVDAHAGNRTSLDSNPDGSRFATSGSDGRVILWDGATGERLATVRPSGPDTDLGLVYLPDGHTMQVANSRGEVFRWDTDPVAWQGFACRTVGRNLTREEWREAFGSEDYRTTCPARPPGD